jgi:hypothetical protein
MANVGKFAMQAQGKRLLFKDSTDAGAVEAIQLARPLQFFLPTSQQLSQTPEGHCYLRIQFPFRSRPVDVAQPVACEAGPEALDEIGKGEVVLVHGNTMDSARNIIGRSIWADRIIISIE